MVAAGHLYPCANLEIELHLFRTADSDAIAANMAAADIGTARHIRQFLIGQRDEQIFFLLGVQLMGVNAAQINFLFHSVSSFGWGYVNSFLFQMYSRYWSYQSS